MKVLLVHPGSLMYSELYLRLEPLGLELIAEACRQAGHDVRIIDLQVDKPGDYFRQVDEWRPQAIGYSLNYLANIPQVVDLARETRQKLPEALLLAGGHSASFVAGEILDHAQGALDCIIRGEGEEVVPRVIAAWEDSRIALETLPGVVTHHTNIVEHPELVAQRLTRLARLVGRENVIGGTDCGFAQRATLRRVHPSIQWAKLRALAEGAALASHELWGSPHIH
jgi:radical SAM superfamily enzyme YgiQ (UPF0313 family)